MNDKIYNIIISYAKRPNNSKVRASMVRELGAQLLEDVPSFSGTIVDRTSPMEEAQGTLNFKIMYNDKEYDISQFKLLVGIKDG